MTPTKPLPLPLIESWMQEMVKNPLQPSEVGPALNPGDPHQDPDVALSLDPQGIPVWWPSKHPQSGVRLQPAQRKAWFLDWLQGELSPRQETLQHGALSYRRRIVAQSLLLTHAESRVGEIPIPDSL